MVYFHWKYSLQRPANSWSQRIYSDGRPWEIWSNQALQICWWNRTWCPLGYWWRISRETQGKHNGLGQTELCKNAEFWFLHLKHSCVGGRQNLFFQFLLFLILHNPDRVNSNSLSVCRSLHNSRAALRILLVFCTIPENNVIKNLTKSNQKHYCFINLINNARLVSIVPEIISVVNLS